MNTEESLFATEDFEIWNDTLTPDQLHEFAEKCALVANRKLKGNVTHQKLQALLNKVNVVTAYHRHGQPIPPSALDELSNRQIEVEGYVKETGTNDR